jgi:uncharacterized OsmC-like protein
MNTHKMTFHVEARRLDAHGSLARGKSAEIALDTDLAGNPDNFNPAGLLLAALSACMIKGIEPVTPLLHFLLRGVEVQVDGVRQDVPPRMESIRYEIVVDTDEPDHKLELLQPFGGHKLFALDQASSLAALFYKLWRMVSDGVARANAHTTQ